jgi:hypothetical protein
VQLHDVALKPAGISKQQKYYILFMDQAQMRETTCIYHKILRFPVYLAAPSTTGLVARLLVFFSRSVVECEGEASQK